MVQPRLTAAHAAVDGELVRAGDSRSLGLLFERYRPRLYAVALTLLGHRAEAEDAVHDAFVTAIVRLPQLVEPQAVGGWLHAIVRNRCLMERRRRAPITGLDDAGVGACAGDDGVERRIEQRQLRDWVWGALRRLPEAQRVTVMLRYFGSYDSYDEVAAILGIPVGTVRSRLSQARRDLAAQLLECAGRGDAAALARQRERELELRQRIDAAYRGDRDALLECFEPDLEVRWSDGTLTRGRGHYAADLDDDLSAGVGVRLLHAMSAGGTTVLEAQLVNPAHDPAHCPPGAVMVLFDGAGRVGRMHLHLAPHPPRDD
jgi:RNA polymerase sigma-70 factor (ECF subfamily)